MSGIFTTSLIGMKENLKRRCNADFQWHHTHKDWQKSLTLSV